MPVYVISETPVAVSNYTSLSGATQSPLYSIYLFQGSYYLLLLKFKDFSRTFRISDVTFQGPIVDSSLHHGTILTISNCVTLVQFYLKKAKHGNYYQFLVLDKLLA